MSARYDETVFATTHNSYSGGDRGSLPAQLDSGVRSMELDLNLDKHRYRIGHGWAGNEVATGGGNPGDFELASWLGAIAGWSDAHRGHAPITLTLDMKPDADGAASFAEGNLAALNQALLDAFGRGRLFTPADRGGAWPAVADMHDHVVCVLSGDAGRRRDYVSDGGRGPAVAINGGDAVVEVHASRRGDLWYWTGMYADGRITWRRHGRIGSGRSPAVALTDDGLVIVVSGGEGDAGCRTGRLDAQGEIAWQKAQRIEFPAAAGDPAPTLRLLGDGTLRVTYEAGYGRRARTGTLTGTDVRWDEQHEAAGDDAQHHRDLAIRGDRVVSVIAVPRKEGDGERLLYGTATTPSAPVQYEQLAFVEAQWVPNLGVSEDATDHLFVATATGSTEPWARQWRERGRLVRLWGFGERSVRTAVNPNFPATDHPRGPWYRDYLRSKGAVET